MKQINWKKFYKLFMISFAYILGIGHFELIFLKISRNDSRYSILFSVLYSVVSMIYAIRETIYYIKEKNQKINQE